MTKKVACVGILVADIMASPFTELPQKGELTKINSITMHNGGNAMTAAINLSNMGIESKIVGKVGDDIYGKFLESKLNDNKIDTRGLKFDSEVQTSVSIVLLDPSGERSFLHCVGTNGVFSIDDIDYSVIEECDLIFVTGSFLLSTFDGEQTAQFLKKCKQLGKETFLDVCWDASGQWSKKLDAAMQYIDYFMPSIDEAIMLADGEESPKKIAEFFIDKGVKNVIIKLGSKGSFIHSPGKLENRFYPAAKLDTVKDTTGAGDSFCSGFIAAYARGENIDTCMKTATACGALCCTESGATTGIKEYDKVINFMEEKLC